MSDLATITFSWESTLPKTNIAMENPPFWWYLQGTIGIFMGYVSFRECTFDNATSAGSKAGLSTTMIP